MFPIMPRRNGQWNECILELSSRLWRDPEPKKRVCRNALEEILPPTKVTPATAAAAAASVAVLLPLLLPPPLTPTPLRPLDLACRMIFTSQEESRKTTCLSRFTVSRYAPAQRRSVDIIFTR